jgi:hypothetical protein
MTRFITLLFAKSNHDVEAKDYEIDGGHVARRVEKMNVCWLLVRKQEEKRPLGRPRRMLMDNIEMDLAEIERCGMDWIGLVQDSER